jgi:glycosyltransferase involved in cell wall biosynthesis
MKPLRILHFSRSDSRGGAARAAYRLHHALRKMGHHSRMIVGEKRTDDADVTAVRMAPVSTFLRKVGARVLPVCGWMDVPDFNANLTSLIHWSPVARRMGSVDVVYLHWINGLLSSAEIAWLAKLFACPIVWVLHDQEPYTGGCHYAYQCTGFHEHCGRCPQLNSEAAHDRSRRSWEDKEKHLSGMAITFVSSCQWTTEQIRRSSLFGAFPVETIGIPTDPQIYRPLDRREARRALGLPIDGRVVFSAAFAVQNPRKGMRYLVDALKQLPAFHPASASEVLFLTAGHGALAAPAGTVRQSHSLGFVETEEKMALAYNAADVFVCPSIYEAGALMIPEAMLCGTPVVAFESGNAPDLIRNPETGYRAALRDTADLARGISLFLNETDAAGRRERAHAAAYDRHAPQFVAERHAGMLERVVAAGRVYRRRAARLPDRLKVVHFSTGDLHGGAAKAATRIHRALREAGHRSLMVVGDRRESDPDIIPARRLRPITLARKLAGRTIPRLRWMDAFDFNADFTPEIFLGSALHEVGAEGRPDVVCLHWITGLLSIRAIRWIYELYGCPIVWLMHDQEPYTGGCHYTYNCNKFKSECQSCPQLNSDRQTDRAQVVWRRKRADLGPLPITFVSSCTWTTERFRDSSIFPGYRVEEIGDALDTSTFHPREKRLARALLGVPSDTKVIFFGAFSILNPRKGMQQLGEALHHVAVERPDLNGIFLLIAGHNSEQLMAGLPYPRKSLGFIADESKLALAYQAADIFVCPSIFEAGAMMVPEAMLCETPVVAFDTGNARDLVHHGETGYRAGYKNSADLGRGIYTLLSSSDLPRIGRAAAAAARDRHAPDRVAMRHTALYRDLLGR